METITLLDGTKKSYDTFENDTFKFYTGSGVHGDMAKLYEAFKAQGIKCALDFGSVYGWFVRIMKQHNE